MLVSRYGFIVFTAEIIEISSIINTEIQVIIFSQWNAGSDIQTAAVKFTDEIDATLIVHDSGVNKNAGKHPRTGRGIAAESRRQTTRSESHVSIQVTVCELFLIA